MYARLVFQGLIDQSLTTKLTIPESNVAYLSSGPSDSMGSGQASGSNSGGGSGGSYDGKKPPYMAKILLDPKYILPNAKIDSLSLELLELNKKMKASQWLTEQELKRYQEIQNVLHNHTKALDPTKFASTDKYFNPINVL